MFKPKEIVRQLAIVAIVVHNHEAIKKYAWTNWRPTQPARIKNGPDTELNQNYSTFMRDSRVTNGLAVGASCLLYIALNLFRPSRLGKFRHVVTFPLAVLTGGAVAVVVADDYLPRSEKTFLTNDQKNIQIFFVASVITAEGYINYYRLRGQR